MKVCTNENEFWNGMNRRCQLSISRDVRCIERLNNSRNRLIVNRSMIEDSNGAKSRQNSAASNIIHRRFHCSNRHQSSNRDLHFKSKMIFWTCDEPNKAEWSSNDLTGSAAPNEIATHHDGFDCCDGDASEKMKNEAALWKILFVWAYTFVLSSTEDGYSFTVFIFKKGTDLFFDSKSFWRVNYLPPLDAQQYHRFGSRLETMLLPSTTRQQNE